jgi:mono/diheme cytochrome c family protein
MAAGSALAQRVDSGEQIAKTWCAGCHVVGRGEQKFTNDATPSFVSIAQMKTTTATGLEVFLSTPHTKMPDYTLTREEIRNVSAYIMSLKSPAAAQP